MSRHWSGRIAHYDLHQNDEHREALFEEAVRYSGLFLENDLSGSEFWSATPLAQRAGLLLLLVDRGIVERTTRRGRRVYEPVPHAESWVESEPSLRSYQKPTLELIFALRHELLRRAHSRKA
jgi:hypothetical protein